MALLFIFVFLALFSFLLCDQVPAPENLTVQAFNTNYVLRWDWTGTGTETETRIGTGTRTRTQTPTFTVNYIGSFRLKRSNPKWNPVCDSSPVRFCDLTAVNLLYLGKHTLRVRAEVNGARSEWRLREFCPSVEGEVGPPTRVTLSSSSNDLEVFFSEPQTWNNSSMKTKISSLFYRVQFWEQTRDHKRSQDHLDHRDSPNSLVVLPELKSWTWYCVRVQSRTTDPNRTSAFTRPVCTSTRGGFQWATFGWVFTVALVGFLVAAAAAVGGVYYCRRINKQTKIIKPAFINELWTFPPLVFLPSDLQSEQCDLLTVKSSPQEHLNSENEEQQSSGDSEDSGIYTTSLQRTETTSENLRAKEDLIWTSEQFEDLRAEH